MVGGLADWFAVTALFRHPLGLPIPHTAIIPTNKDRIADTMADFLRTNFLTPVVVARRMREMNVARAAGEFLVQRGEGDGGAGRVMAGAGALLVELLESLDPERLGVQVKAGLARQAEKIDVAPLLGRMLAGAIAEEMGLGAARLADVPDRVLATLAARVSAWTISPVGSEGYRTAEVTLGGVDGRDLDARTLESRRVPGLHFIGEVVDVTGWLGGYNFQWAWASAHAAARAILAA